MKKFIFKISILGLPCLMLFYFIENFCYTKSTFAIKKSFLTLNLNSIELLILGSSHTQNAINPEFLSKKTSNLAFGRQPISIEYYLIDKYIDNMPNLKTIILEISCHRFYNDLSPSYWNGYIYSILYNIKYNTSPLSIRNYSFTYSDYQYFSSMFYNYYNPFGYKYKTNKYGFVTNLFNDRFEKLKYDTIRIKKTFVMSHEFGDIKLFRMNKDFLIKSILFCKNKRINVILITPPLYNTYLSQIPDYSINEVDSLINKICGDYQIKWFNYSADKRFNIKDFLNDNHLNSNGAEKFSKIINTEILIKN